MNLKAVAAVALSAALAAGAANAVASTPPDSDTPVDSEAPTGDGTNGSDPPTTLVTTSVTITADSASSQTDGSVPDNESSAETTIAEPATEQASEQNQTVVVTATVVAGADTGSNQAASNGSGSSLPAAPGAIDTGDAIAVGSDDETDVSQGAQVVLTDAATANILQLALVINIGAAIANSGLNAVGGSGHGGGGGSGAIASGDASATGLDIEQYITQVARQDADAATDASSSQVAISLWMGMAVADSGSNSVAGAGTTAAAGGGVGTGDASAVGNESSTEIEQYAAILGVDSSTTNITQRATVLNVGFALANSGLNDVSNVAGGLLSASETDDDAVAQQLFAMLLPALLQSYGYGPAQGTISSGDATAVGNDSETFVRQVAMAAASGDGQVDIVQDVLVANMGAAAANTGGNSLGAVRPIDRETADAVVTMAAFMAEMLSMVHRSANSASLTAQRQGIDIPFQGLLLRLDGSFDGLDTQVSEGGSRANIRQVSVIVSLGIADANTGGNLSQADAQQGASVNALHAGDAVAVLAVDGNGNVITTGDAAAGNREVVVICQRLNADDMDCLAPPTTTEPPVTTVSPSTSVAPVTAPPTGPPGPGPQGTQPPGAVTAPPGPGPSPFGPPVTVPAGMLPATGGGESAIALAGLAALLLGVAAVLAGRKRTAP